MHLNKPIGHSTITHEEIHRIAEKFRHNYDNVLLFQIEHLLREIQLNEGECSNGESWITKMRMTNELSFWYSLKPATLWAIDEFMNKAIKDKEKNSTENQNQAHQSEIAIRKRQLSAEIPKENGMF